MAQGSAAARVVKAASLIAAAILVAGFLIAYHPRHPFGWGSPKTSKPCLVQGGFPCPITTP